MNFFSLCKRGAALAAAALAFATGSVQARDVNWSVGVYAPGVSVGVNQGYPVVLAPAPMYAPPPRPMYHAPAPVYYQAPPPAHYYGPPPHAHRHPHHRQDWGDRHHGRGHGHGHGHGRGHDRGHDRGHWDR